MTDAAMAMPTRRVDLWYAGTAPQGRLSVGFRIILAIPQVVVLYFLFIALFFVVVIGWFAALFMGRLPDWAHSFISGVVRWSTRVGAYLLLLTDQYPPFSLDDEDYPARPILPDPGPLNRWAVLFRIILAVPGAVFVQIVQYGLTIPLLLVMWFVVLVRGSMPPALYLAYAALLRYETRFHSWFSMLTSEYPWGMLGDRAQAPAPLPPGAPAGPPPYQAPPPAPQAIPPTQAPAQPFSYPPASGTPGQAAPAGEPAVPAVPGAPVPAPGWPPPMPAPPPAGVGAMPPPSPWERTAVPPPPGGELPPWGTLVLEGAARSWMIFAIVWGSIVFVGQTVTQNALGGNRHNNTGVVQDDAVQRGATSSIVGSDAHELVTLAHRLHGDP
jgi:hypothetical protein